MLNLHNDNDGLLHYYCIDIEHRYCDKIYMNREGEIF